MADYYHAVERLTDFAKSRGEWSEKRASTWVKQQKARLKRGWIERIEGEVAKHQTPTEREAGTESKYWRRNRERDEVPGLSEDGAAEWQWCGGIGRPACREPPLEGTEHRLARGACRGGNPPSGSRQGGSLGNDRVRHPAEQPMGASHPTANRRMTPKLHRARNEAEIPRKRFDVFPRNQTKCLAENLFASRSRCHPSPSSTASSRPRSMS